MKKILYIIIGIMCLGCSSKKQVKEKDSKDSIVTVFDMRDNRIKIPLDSFLLIKDSFVYCKEEELWMTKELFKWNYEYPDTIKVAFTRNGIVEDSVEAVRQGAIEDSIDKPYSPAYVYFSVVGDSWVYDVNGKYIGFNESSYPHSGKGIKYEP